jgi:predicted ArsR family transcriptional regulator
MTQQEAKESETIPRTEALAQILTSVERLAMLYHHFASTLVDELGSEKGKALIRKAIEAYGTEVGERQRRRVTEAGYAASCENYKALPDLPAMAWSQDGMPRMMLHGKETPVCPLAKYWIEKGASGLGRLYCHVDQAKYSTFDPESECRHLENVLDGDERCLIVVKKKSEWGASTGGVR